MTNDPEFTDETICILAGRDPKRHGGSASAPVDRSYTRIFEDLPSIRAAYSSGRLSAFLGSETPDYLADAIAALEGPGAQAIITSSGISALTIVFLALLNPGDHMLVPDSAFGPTRNFAEKYLSRIGVETSYYAPSLGVEIATEFRPSTRLLLLESPGSNTFEVQDVPAIAEKARQAGITVAIDNSWASPYLFKPLQHGVDISICAVTKYLLGHSDAVLGSIATTERYIDGIRDMARLLGDHPSADDAWLTLRGLRTLPVRLRQHDESGRRIAAWLAEHPAVSRVLHPALPGTVGHEFWKRDFKGATGLFGLVLKQLSDEKVETFLHNLKLFRLGYSWGSFESLAIPVRLEAARTKSVVTDGHLIRMHVGLEDPDDLIQDLKNGFAAIGL